MELVLFTGIQGTGKSEFYKQEFYKTHIRINLDMLRTRHREKLLVNACLEAKQPFVVDNTNPTAADRARYITQAKDHDFTVIGYYFSSELQKAIERNDQRFGKEKVPVPALIGTYKRLELPAYAEGFDKLYYVTIAPEGGFIIQEYQEEME